MPIDPVLLPAMPLEELQALDTQLTQQYLDLLVDIDTVRGVLRLRQQMVGSAVIRHALTPENDAIVQADIDKVVTKSG